jgi:hypothetical protein
LLIPLSFSPEIVLPFFAHASVANDPQWATWRPLPMVAARRVGKHALRGSGMGAKIGGKMKPRY